MNWPPAHPEAREEFRHAITYFRDTVSKALARRFTLKTMSTVDRARQFPMGGPPTGAEARRIQFRPFSYDLIYLLEYEGDIYIIAIAHHRQRPGYWRIRT